VLYCLVMTDLGYGTDLSTAGNTSTAVATANSKPEPEPEPEPEPDRAADDWLPLPWPVADADEGRMLRREMALRALI
jgi:hypothetical protein